MNNQSIQILLVEDNQGDFVLYSEYLTEIYTSPLIYHATSIKEALELVKKYPIDVILLDLSLPDGMGINTFEILHKEAENIPIIILTGLMDSSIALESLHEGAQDFIEKNECNPTLLGKSINYAIERIKIYKQIKKSEEQYKYLFHNNPLPMIAFDAETNNIFMVNSAAKKLYGYNDEEFAKMHMSDLLYKTPKTTLTSYSDTDNDYKHQKKDKTIIDVEINEHPISLEGKKARLEVIHDVTERNRAKEQVRQSEQNFKTISENFPNGSIALLDSNLNIIYTAGKEFIIKDVTSSHFVNTRFVEYFSPSEKDYVKENLQNVFNGVNTVFEVSQNDQTYIISGVPLYESNGLIKKILIATQNISQQKKNEKEKELLIEELTRTNSDLKQFSYITSHNLRAPLSNLLGLIKLLDLNNIQDPTTKLLIENFEECALQLNDTVNDLINVLIIKNNLNTTRELIRIDEVFEKVCQSIKNHIDETDTTITKQLNPEHKIVFNNTYIESILLNLLTNAIKYRSPNRKPHITLTTEKFAGGVKLYFSDNGMGIDLAKYKDRIFGLYQRFHSHADSKGLGLYIVKSQIDVMGGEINVKSDVGRGTTFIITFKN